MPFFDIRKKFAVAHNWLTGQLKSNVVSNANIKKSFGAEQTVSVGAGEQETIAAGIYLVVCGSNTKVEYTPDGGTTWRTVIAAGGGGAIISDGSSVRLNNTGAAEEDSYLLPLA